jgi:hypothetical protein
VFIKNLGWQNRNVVRLRFGRVASPIVHLLDYPIEQDGVSPSKSCTYFWRPIGDRNAPWAGILYASKALAMETEQAKWFLQVFANGKKLSKINIRELYLSGYIGIELHSPGKEPLPTVITEKGKRVLAA